MRARYFLLFLVFFITQQSCEKGESPQKPISKKEALTNLEKSLANFNSQKLKSILIEKSSKTNADEEIAIALQPILNNSKLVLDAYEIDYNKEFQSVNDPQIIITSLVLLTLEKEFQAIDSNGSSKIKLLNNSKGAWDCAMEAIGVAAVAELISSIGSSAAIQASRTLILKTVGKIASRYAGWIGAAIMVADFAECMATGD